MKSRKAGNYDNGTVLNPNATRLPAKGGRRRQIILIFIAAIVTFTTIYMFICPAITMDVNVAAKCGCVHHKHTDACYSRTGELTCGVPEHEHDMSCFTDGYKPEKYSCGFDYEHKHDSSCYKNGKLVCSLKEHIHTDCTWILNMKKHFKRQTCYS